MTYRVLWRDGVANALLVQMIRAANKPSIFSSAREIERLLSQTPGSIGESRGSLGRILYVRPLAVVYKIDEPNKIVYVERLQWVGV